MNLSIESTSRALQSLRDIDGVYGSFLIGASGETRARDLPSVFDEQVRHLGRMPAAQALRAGWHEALAGGSNVLVLDRLPLVLGTTPSRLVLNAELFEKCAKACVLAIAAGGDPAPLPWIVRHVANRRLLKDEARARARVAQGQLPEESRGY